MKHILLAFRSHLLVDLLAHQSKQMNNQQGDSDDVWMLIVADDTLSNLVALLELHQSRLEI